MNEPSLEEMGLNPNSPEMKNDEERKLQLAQQEAVGIENQIDDSEGKTPEEIEELQRQFEAKKNEQMDMEKDFLSVSQIETKDTNSLHDDITSPEQNESELKEEREKFVKEYIESVVEDFTSHWQSELSASANGEKAARLIALKTESTITVEAQGFIEQGGQPDFGGGYGELQLSYFDSPDGNRVQYVTGFELHSNGGVSSVGESEMTRNDEEGQEEINKAKETDDLHKKEV